MENLNLFIKSIFIDNMIFAYFLGMCSFLAVSKNVKTAFGLGIAVSFVLIIALPVTWCINTYVLQPGSLSWLGSQYAELDLSFLGLIIFIAVMQQRDFSDAWTATVYGAGSGIGWLLAITCIAAIRERLSYNAIPAPLRGTGITFIVTGLMGIAFMSFLGIKL